LAEPEVARTASTALAQQQLAQQQKASAKWRYSSPAARHQQKRR